MLTIKEMGNMDFGLEVGREYRIDSRVKRSKGEASIKRGIYLGQGGVENCYIIFQSPKHGFKECFLKIDIISGEYFIKDLDRKIKMEVANG